MSFVLGQTSTRIFSQNCLKTSPNQSENLISSERTFKLDKTEEEISAEADILNGINPYSSMSAIDIRALLKQKKLKNAGNFLLIYICNFHVLSHLLFIYICKLHWNQVRKQSLSSDYYKMICYRSSSDP
jgi:hypothetical protein